MSARGGAPAGATFCSSALSMPSKVPAYKAPLHEVIRRDPFTKLYLAYYLKVILRHHYGISRLVSYSPLLNGNCLTLSSRRLRTGLSLLSLKSDSSESGWNPMPSNAVSITCHLHRLLSPTGCLQEFRTIFSEDSLPIYGRAHPG